MNTNPHAIRVLCYGDSITRGRVPVVIDRYDINIRWTGLLQTILGSQYEIIEEGLRGRTVFGDYKHLLGRNGLQYWYPCLLSHFPLDMIVLFLGTNDLQNSFSHTIEEIGNMFALYDQYLIQASEEFQLKKPHILLISPPYIDANELKEGSVFGNLSGILSREFSKVYSETAIKYGRHFLDAGLLVGCGVGDGVHLNPEQNKKLAEALASSIQNISL